MWGQRDLGLRPFAFTPGPDPPRFPGMVAVDNGSPFPAGWPKGLWGLCCQHHSSSGFNWPELSVLGEEWMEFRTRTRVKQGYNLTQLQGHISHASICKQSLLELCSVQPAHSVAGHGSPEGRTLAPGSLVCLSGWGWSHPCPFPRLLRQLPACHIRPYSLLVLQVQTKFLNAPRPTWQQSA